MTDRRLLAVPAGSAAAVLDALLPAVAAALEGRGPAVLPLTGDPEAAARIERAVRPDLPLEHAETTVVVATAGSTGHPKGVLLSADALTFSAKATHARLGGPGRWLLALPTHHIAGLQLLVRSLVAGTPPVALELGSGFRISDFLTAAARMGDDLPRYTSLVPTQLRRLLDAGGPAVQAVASFAAVLVGGAPCPPSLLARARGAGVRVVASYGMTETCGGCVYDGRPLDGVRLAVGDDGRIRVRGPVLFAGYRLRPDLTAAAFDEDGWMVTDDVGHVDAGERLHVDGRADDVVVSGGEKVALTSVQAALVAHPAVREAAAFAVDDETWGQRVVALVVPGSELPPVAELRDWVSARTGRAGAPRDVVAVGALPLLDSGKVDRRAVQVLAGEAVREGS
jgi:O-succinylbenzoic acid--CoA ligase